MIEDGFDFLPAQDDRQFLFLFRPDKFKTCPFSFKSECVEMFNIAKRYGRGHSGPFAFVFVVEEILFYGGIGHAVKL